MTNKAPRFPIYQPELRHSDTEQDPASNEGAMVAVASTAVGRIREIRAIDSKLGIVDDALAKLSMLPEGYKTHSSSMGGVVLLESEAQGGWISYEPDWASLQCALRDTKREARREQREKNKMGTVAKLRAAGAAACSTLFRSSASIEEALQRRQALLDELFPCQITNETLQQRGIQLPRFANSDLSKLYDMSEGTRFLTRTEAHDWRVAHVGEEVRFKQPDEVMHAALYDVIVVDKQPSIADGLWQHVQPHVRQLTDTLQLWQDENDAAKAARKRQQMLATPNATRVPQLANARAATANHRLDARGKIAVQQLEYIQRACFVYGEHSKKQQLLEKYAGESCTQLNVYALDLAQQLVESDQHRPAHVTQLFHYIDYIKQDIASSGHGTSPEEYFAALNARMPKGTRLDYATFRQALLR